MQNAIKNIFRPPGGKTRWVLSDLRQGNSIFHRRLNLVLLYGSFAFLLFGVKLWIIGYNGNVTPFWDQWDAEASLLYRRYLDNTLGWNDLIAPHNEHRIFTTRLLALGLLKINHTWNPLLQMVVNAGLHILAIMLCICLLSRIVGKNSLPALLAFSLILFGVPNGWENTLAGFQAQFYFVVLFSIGAVWMLLGNEPLSIRWWVGILFAALAFLSLASGVFVLAAVAFVSFIIFITGLRRTGKQLTAIAVLCVLFIAGVKLTPTIEGHAQYKASSFHQFYDSLIAVLGWPVSENFIAALICNLPAFIFLISIIRKRPSVDDRRWILLGLVLWMLTQVVSIAYGRSTMPLASKYRDLFSFLILVNFGCLLYIVYTNLSKWGNRMVFAAGLWMGIVLICLGLYGSKHLPDEIATKRVVGHEEEINTRNYLATGDMSHLKDKPHLYIPFPNPERLAEIIELPGIRGILPVNLRAPLKASSIEIKPAGAFMIDGYYFSTPKRLDTTWGSYIPGQGDGAMGQLTMRFENRDGGYISIPVAGYPLNKGISLETEQNGKRTPISIKINPKETWGTAYAKTGRGEFSLHLTDSSASTWLAVGKPVKVSRRLDAFTDRLLSGYYIMFMLLGLIGIVFLVMQNYFNGQTKTAQV